MADIRCPKCGEPVDIDELHEMGDYRQEELTFQQATELFWSEGCAAFGWAHAEQPDLTRAGVSAMLHDLLGDDVDGISSSLEDFDYVDSL